VKIGVGFWLLAFGHAVEAGWV